MGLYIRSARSLLLAYSFVLAASLSASLLRRYLQSNFSAALKGPRCADMLFVTRESRHGCLRQAGRQTRRFPPQSRKLRTSRRRLPYLDFSTAISPLFPSTSGVSFTCLPALPGRAGRFQPPRGRSLSTAPRRGRTG